MPRQHFTRVQHQYTTRVYTHGVMPRVLLCKLCACVTRVFCVCHACLLRVARVSSACRTRGLFKLWVICTVHAYISGFKEGQGGKCLLL